MKNNIDINKILDRECDRDFLHWFKYIYISGYLWKWEGNYIRQNFNIFEQKILFWNSRSKITSGCLFDWTGLVENEFALISIKVINILRLSAIILASEQVFAWNHMLYRCIRGYKYNCLILCLECFLPLWQGSSCQIIFILIYFLSTVIARGDVT